MNTSFWAPYISDGTIKAICWTLIHSLWIGMIIALLAGIIISLTRKSAATLRYRLLCAILVLFVFSMAVTCFIEVRANTITPIPPPPPKVFITIADATSLQHATVVQNQNIIDRTKEFLNQNTNIIFLVWLLLFMLKSLKLVSGLLYIQRIRNYRVHEVAEEFKQKIELFSRQIGIRQTVRLVQSELVKVPAAVGWLKPMILLPVGIAFQLTPEQLDGILWHELAHIRRRDYLVNILQGLVETVFFFNPGLLWLSSLIRTEREACCDDMVLSRMNRKANYVEALLAFGYGEFKQAGLAMSIGSGNQLRDRLKRMISQENKRLSIAEKVVLAIGLVVLSAFTTMPKTTMHAAQNLVNVMVKKPGHTDTMKSKIITTDSATKQTGMFGETKAISSDTLHSKTDTAIRFRSVLFKRSDSDLTNNDISAMSIAGRKYHFIVANGKLVAMDIDGEKIKDSDLPNYQYLITQIDVEVLEKRHIRETDMARFKANQPDVKFKADKGFDKKRYIDPRFHNDSLYNVKYDATLQKMREIMADLAVRKVVPDAASVKWFALTDNEFIVNGQKQPDELQQRYKAKYGVHEGWGLYYGPVPMKGKGVFIDPQGMSKALHLNDSIRSERFKARYGADDDRRALKLQMMRQRLHDDSINYAAQKNRALNVIADLVHDKAVRDPASVKWFGLSNTEFLVNGQKQSGEMQQRYKAKYGIYEGNGLYYGPVQMHGVGVFIDVADSRPPLPPRPPKEPREPGSGYVQPKYADTNSWKLRQLIKQQQAFAADLAKKRGKLVQEQQVFASDQAKKREQIMHQQQDLRADQELAGLKQQWIAKSGIYLEPVIASVISDLVSANVIQDKNELVKFNLTNSALMVNGKKQPDELHEKLKAKYLEQPKLKSGITGDPNFGLHYDAKNGASGLGITSGPDSP